MDEPTKKLEWYLTEDGIGHYAATKNLAQADALRIIDVLINRFNINIEALMSMLYGKEEAIRV